MCAIVELKVIDDVENDRSGLSMERAKDVLKKPVQCNPIACSMHCQGRAVSVDGLPG